MIVIGMAAGSCGINADRSPNPGDRVLRVGIGQLSQTNPIAGVRQLIQLLTVEGLGRLAEDGHVEPSLAEKWTVADGGRALIVSLKRGVTFHDGSPVNAETVVALLPDALRNTAGPLFDDIEHVRVVDSTSIEIAFRHPSPLLQESLEVPIRKPGDGVVATGPFMSGGDPAKSTALLANPEYYGGAPSIAQITINPYPSVRSAWADLLRDRIDMLFEVGPDALDSLESSTNIGVFTLTRRYQYTVILNTDAPALRPAPIRRALNLAIDRSRLVKEALNGHAVPSSGPIWPQYWALPFALTPIQPATSQAAAILKSKRVRFTCLIPIDQAYERIGLELKRQFSAVGVDMDLQAASHDVILEAQRKRTFDAVMVEIISGPTLLRLYQAWNARSPVYPGKSAVDGALERVRQAQSVEQFREATAGVHAAFMDDPPAIFLAWTERARAVSKRFVVPVESGRDILGSIRLWKPATGQRQASRN